MLVWRGKSVGCGAGHAPSCGNCRSSAGRPSRHRAQTAAVRPVASPRRVVPFGWPRQHAPRPVRLYPVYPAAHPRWRRHAAASRPARTRQAAPKRQQTRRNWPRRSRARASPVRRRTRNRARRESLAGGWVARAGGRAQRQRRPPGLRQRLEHGLQTHRPSAGLPGWSDCRTRQGAFWVIGVSAWWSLGWENPEQAPDMRARARSVESIECVAKASLLAYGLIQCFLWERRLRSMTAPDPIWPRPVRRVCAPPHAVAECEPRPRARSAAAEITARPCRDWLPPRVFEACL